ncbi:MAG: hypothetical protein JW841_11530 [Deltaproteobacteria bacterium]|nr:hypothetical protein [Deltaproteobacteria bacterium]
MYLARLIEKILKAAIREFPFVALVGARQTGKSTTLKHLFAPTSHTLANLVNGSKSVA